ncbi:MAG TPA: putative Ig domain-containing protein [Nocardioidaceae bacterium]|nr:putative Ig domain-containing protein [Nocardioidaceae bacterium]
MARRGFWWVVVLAFAVLLPSLLSHSASAVARVSRAEVTGTQLRIEGTAVANRAITVDGVRMTTSDGSGRFRVDRSGYTRPADCTVDVNDGSATPVTVRLSGCTVASPTPSPATNTISPDVAGFAANVGTPFLETFVFGPAVTSPSSFRLVSGALPAGLALTEIPITSPRPFPQNAIRVQGTPTTVQASTFTLRATDANGLTATRTYTITVAAPRPLSITPQACYSPECPLVEGSPQNLFFDGAGGVLPYSWSISAGALPPGMTLIQDSPTVGLVRIGGTPTTAGAYSFTLRLTDARQATLERQISVVVTKPVAPALVELAVTPNVVGGTTVMATARLVSAAPPGGATVALASSSAVAAVPASVTIPAGETFAAFPVATSRVTQSTLVTLTAGYSGATRTASLTVTP